MWKQRLGVNPSQGGEAAPEVASSSPLLCRDGFLETSQSGLSWGRKQTTSPFLSMILQIRTLQQPQWLLELHCISLILVGRCFPCVPVCALSFQPAWDLLSGAWEGAFLVFVSMLFL